MDDVSCTLAVHDQPTSPYGDSYIPGGWLESRTAFATRKRKAAFDLPSPKRPSPPRLVASSNFLQTIKGISPVRLIQRVLNLHDRPQDDTLTSHNDAQHLSSQRSREKDAKNTIEYTRKLENKTFRHSAALYGPIERTATASIPLPAISTKNSALQPKTRFTNSFQSSTGSKPSAQDLTAMYAEQKRARKTAMTRAALLQIRQPRKDQLQKQEKDEFAEETVLTPKARPKLVPIVTPRMQPISHPSSPSVQLFHELESSLQPPDVDSDNDNTAIDPSWTIPRKPHARTVSAQAAGGSHDPASKLMDTTTADGSRTRRQHSPPVISRRIRPTWSERPPTAYKAHQSPASCKASAALAMTETEPEMSDLANLTPGSFPAIERPEEMIQSTTTNASSELAVRSDATHVGSVDSEADDQHLSQSVEPLLDVSKLTIADDSPLAVETPKASGHSGEKLIRLTRAQIRKKQLEEEALNQYEIVPLSADWDAKVRHAVQQGHGSYASSDLARAVPEYAGRGQDNWLNDEVINGYLGLVTAHGKKNDRPNQTPTYHAFNSFFYNNLSSKGPDSVMRWSKRPKINGTNLLNVEAVFIPINTGVHWTLAVVEPKKKIITHYNSMRSTALGMAACAHIKKWVAKELGKDFDDEEWTLVAAGESPQQTNSDDCGVFTITSARQIMLGFKPMSYRSDQMRVQRKRIVAELINGGLLKSRESSEG